MRRGQARRRVETGTWKGRFLFAGSCSRQCSRRPCFTYRTERYVEKNEKYRCLNRLKTLRNRVNVCEDLSDRDKVLEKLRNRTSVRENVATLASMCKVQFERKKDKAVMSNEDTAKLEAWRSVDDLMEGRDENCVFFVVEDIMEHTFA